MDCEAESITVEISDDGVGFDPGEDFPGHLGLCVPCAKRPRDSAGRWNLRPEAARETESAPGYPPESSGTTL